MEHMGWKLYIVMHDYSMLLQNTKTTQNDAYAIY